MPEAPPEGFASAPTVLNLRLLLLTTVIAYGIYRYIRRRIAYQVWTRTFFSQKKTSSNVVSTEG